MKTRKLLALVLAIAMMASIFVVPSAAVEAGAACEILGLLEGDGDGVTAEYLAKGTTRAQGLLITLRAQGLEDAAKAFTGTDTFSDAADVNVEFWGAILAYAKANPSCGWVGYGDGTFHPAAVMTGAELAKVMLALLGYEQGVDFEWADIATFAASKGITVAEGSVDNNDLAASLVEALAADNKDGVKLVDALIAAEVITEAQAVEADVKEEVPAAPYTVAVTGVKTIVVTFAAAQDTATAIITLKKGVVGQSITTTWNTAKTVATIAKTTSLTAGDYTLTANSVATSFNVAANETATELVMRATTVYKKAAAQDIKIYLLNQYGEQMAYSSANVVGGVSLGTLTFVSNSATLTLPGTLPAAGTTITVFAYYAAKNFTVNSTITVIDDQKLASIAFAGPVTQGTASKAYTRLTEGTTGNTLAFKAYDQYGNVLNLTSYVAGTDYTLVISNATATVGNGVLTLDTVTKGTFSVRAIVMATGAVSEMFSETVYAVPALASFDVTVPDAIYATTAAAFVVAGLDQYGKAITVTGAQLDAMTINPLSTTVTIGTEANTDNKSTLTFAAAGTADLYFIGSTTVIKTITVLAAKAVAEINSVTAPVALETTNTYTIATATDVKLKDQYGNAIAIDLATYSLELRRLAETNPYGVVSTGTDATAITLAGLTMTAQKAGTEQLRLTYYTGGAYGSTATSYKEFIYDFAVTVVDKASIVTYELTTSKDVMCTNAGRNAAHDLTITLVGKTANGTAVTLVAAAGALPTIVAQYTVTGTGAAIAGNKLTVGVVGVAETVTLKAWNNAGVVVASKDVVLDKTAPALTGAVTIAVSTAGLVSVTAKDQFGVAIAAPAGTFYTSDAAKIVLSGATGTTVQADRASGATALTAVVRYVSANGAYSAEISVTR